MIYKILRIFFDNICIFHVDKKPIKYKVKDEIRFGKSRNHR